MARLPRKYRYLFKLVPAGKRTRKLRQLMAAAGEGSTPTPAPVFTSQPSITGTSQAGQTLTAVDGSAAFSDGVTRQWYLDGAAAGTGTTLSLAAGSGDVGKVPSLRNFASGPGGGPVQSNLATAAAVVAAGSGATEPGAPTIGTATAGDASVSVAGTAPASNGGAAIDGYRAVPYIGGVAGTPGPVGSTLPATIPAGLVNGTAYTFKLQAHNSVGWGTESAESNSVTPSAAASVLRQVGTRCVLPRQRLSTDKQFNSRAFARVPGGVSNPVFVFPGFMGANNVSTPTGDGDLGMGGPMGLRASLECPAGVFTRLTFSGSTTGTVADLGELQSDPAAGVVIPDNAGIWVWVYGTFVGAGTPVMFASRPQDNNYSLLGEALERGASGIEDKSGGGAITTIAGSPGLVYRPIKILGQVPVATRSFAVVGDSKEAGFGSLFGEHDADGQLGVIARAVSSTHGVTVCAIGGDQGRVWDSPARVASRSKLLDPVTDVVIALGVNDVSNGQTIAQIIVSLSAIRDVAIGKGKRVGRKTIEPRTASTDNFATATNQTTQSNESVRIAANAWIRDPANWPGDSYLIDVADMVEVNAANALTRNGGRWISTGVALENVFDGIHPTLKLILSIKPAIRAAIGI